MITATVAARYWAATLIAGTCQRWDLTNQGLAQRVSGCLAVPRGGMSRAQGDLKIALTSTTPRRYNQRAETCGRRHVLWVVPGHTAAPAGAALVNALEAPSSGE